MNIDLKLKAEEFADSLKKTPAIEKFLSAKIKFEKDNEVQGMIRRFQEKQQAVYYGKGGSSDELTELRNKILSNETFLEFNGSQQDAFEAVRLINEKLTELIGFDISATAAPPAASC